MSQIELNKKNCDELLKKFVELGYKNARAFSIKDGALVAKCFRVIHSGEKDEKVTESVAYETLFKVLEVANSAGVFSFDDAAVMDIVIDLLKKAIASKEKADKKPDTKPEDDVEEL